MNILVIGATGMLGKPVTNELVNAGYRVSALVRNREKAEKELPSGVQLIIGDLKKRDDVRNALSGQDAVYLNLSVKRNEKESDWHSESNGLDLLTPEARDAGVKRIVYLSSLVMRYQGMNGFDWWVFRIKNEAVKKLKNSGIPSTIFYPSNFMQSLSHMYKMGNKMMTAGKSKYKMFFVAAEDYGKQVANSLRFNDTQNREYVVQGPEGFTADEAVKEFVKHYSREKLYRYSSPLWMIKLFGKFSREMSYGGNILEALNNYPEKFEAQNTWEELGKPAITISSFAASLK